MQPSKDIEPVTTLKTQPAQLIRRARETGAPIVITQNGRATAVLQDVESWERERKALAMLRLVARGDQDLREGRVVPHEEAAARLDAMLDDLP